MFSLFSGIFLPLLSLLLLFFFSLFFTFYSNLRFLFFFFILLYFFFIFFIFYSYLLLLLFIYSFFNSSATSTHLRFFRFCLVFCRRLTAGFLQCPGSHSISSLSSSSSSLFWLLSYLVFRFISHSHPCLLRLCPSSCVAVDLGGFIYASSLASDPVAYRFQLVYIILLLLLHYISRSSCLPCLPCLPCLHTQDEQQYARFTMEWSPNSFSPSSPRARAWSGSHVAFDPYASSLPSDSSPVSARYAEYPPATGLGIVHCGFESHPGHLRLCPPSEAYTNFPTPGWSIPSDPLQQRQEHILEAGQYPSTTTTTSSYEPYHEIASPLSLYSAQTLSASPSYSSVMERGDHHSTLSGQSFGYWSTTPRSDITTPPERFIKDESLEYWSPPVISEDRNPFETSTMMMMMPMPQVVLNDGLSDPQLPEHTTTNSDRSFVKQDQQVEIKQEPRNTPETPNTERQLTQSSSDTDGDNTKSPPVLKPRTINARATSGLQCSICGACFTRRSNRREHEKRHDPSRKSVYQCELCGRTFGRKTDRKRHTESVSVPSFKISS